MFKNNSDWSFGGNVFKNFEKHIDKSVPLYSKTHELYLNFSDFFLQNNSTVLDIGCSTGNFLNSVYRRHNLNGKKIKLIGVDNTKEMVQFCKKKYKKNKINFLLKDIDKFKISNCCIISSFYTIQFISPKKRQMLINKIFKGLNWGGAFFMVEKVRGPDARFQDMLNQVYIEYKLSQGFTESQIISKSKSLKGILEPFSTKGNLDLIKRAGFKDVITVFKYGSFEGFLAIK
ncbi:methyltransferase domain-containing protein [Pelagibacterales bacterium SAG-MED05]|nr:methyltransferase domain-containing protein [Pelagibacterales bacterium SAG-MED05]